MIEKKKYRFKKASQEEIDLFILLGQSLCAVQMLEGALSHLIVLKKTEPDQKKEADDLLKKQRSLTFGNAMKIAKEESLLSKPLEIELSKLLKERNWLVHHSITDNKNDFKSDTWFNQRFEKIEAITSKANELQISIEIDLIEYCEKKGIDMTNIKNKIDKHYGI
ncbi:hypothetical protein [Aquimarina algiphila]|uniref:hypothetical protein n=1 Tax=Aquimarina algiphila TaxID=2047982 RepID=UPI0024930CBF|nr:hypothetical protein [Aquimarina algiphila]